MQSSFAIQGVRAAAVPHVKTAVKKAASSGFSGVLQKTLQSARPAKSLDDIFKEASEKYRVPEKLLKAVGRAESNFHADEVSSCGAQGIMQLMPGTAKSLGVEDPFDPEQNIMGGAKYLSSLLGKYGDEKLAVAAYNAGSGNVDKYGGIPPFQETQNYVRRVLGYEGEDFSVPEEAISSSSPSGAGTAVLGTESAAAPLADFTFDDYRLFLQIFLKALEGQSAANLMEPSAQGGGSSPNLAV